MSEENTQVKAAVSKYPATLELAMLAVQSELTNPIKDTLNPHFKALYATLPEIRNLVTPILAKHGLFIYQAVSFDEQNNVFLGTNIVHAPTAESVKSKMPLMMDRQTPQGQGSAITYARRYALCAMLNIAADEDDDGQEAETPKTKPKAAAVKSTDPEYLTKSREAYVKLNKAVKAKDRELFNAVWQAYQVHLDELNKHNKDQYTEIYNLYNKLPEQK